jgi:hypothetical protein
MSEMYLTRKLTFQGFHDSLGSPCIDEKYVIKSQRLVCNHARCDGKCNMNVVIIVLIVMIPLLLMRCINFFSVIVY